MTDRERELLADMDDNSVEQISEFSGGLDSDAKKRILEKTDLANESLKELYGRKSAVIKNLVSFSANTPDIKSFKTDKDFTEIYPFLP